MLIIENNGADVVRTNYWQSELNQRSLVYLSVNDGVLRLFLPTLTATEWLAEIKTGNRCIIEPSLRPAYPDYLDLVFDDGTKNPFNLSIEPTLQCDRQLDSSVKTLKIYAGNLERCHEMPCDIRVSQTATASEEKYFEHVTINTGDSTRSRRSAVQDDVFPILEKWWPDLLAGTTRFIWDDLYAVNITWHNSKGFGATISRANPQMEFTPLVNFATCLHSRQREKVWLELGGTGEPPSVPYLAIRLIEENMTFGDLPHLPMFADFERTLAWSFIEQMQPPSV